MSARLIVRHFRAQEVDDGKSLLITNRRCQSKWLHRTGLTGSALYILF